MAEICKIIVGLLEYLKARENSSEIEVGGGQKRTKLCPRSH